MFLLKLLRNKKMNLHKKMLSSDLL